jgi:hypothetical protein
MSDDPRTDSDDEQVVGESRWPMAGAVLTVILLTIFLPKSVRVNPSWIVPGLEAALLVVLILGDPGAIDRRSRRLRAMSVTLVAVLVLSALAATVGLIAALIEGGAVTNSPGALLAAGSIVWVSNCIAFALLYWELDGGGAAARAHGLARYPDLAFVQQVNPDLAPPGWRPVFLDYLYLGVTNATAFSPTDVMPLAAWAKIAMTVQSLISLGILGLVIARAVNILS